MSYRYLFRLVALLSLCAGLATTAQAQTRVQELLKQRQEAAKQYLQQDASTRGNLVTERTESQRVQENKSIALSHTHSDMLTAMDRVYQQERQKYAGLPLEQQKQGFVAYESYRKQLVDRQRDEMACNLNALNAGQKPNCPGTSFDEKQLAKVIKAAVIENKLPPGTESVSGTLTAPKVNPGVRLGGSSSGSATPQAYTVSTPHNTGVHIGGGGGGGGYNRRGTFSQQMQ